MKRTAIITLATLALAASAASAQETKGTVEVLYFHGAKRCVTCNAIETRTKELVATDYKKEVTDGILVLRTVDFSKKENRSLADKYEVTFPALFVNVHKNGKETKNDMTKFAFATARSKPDEFKAGLKKKIDEYLATLR